MYIEQNNNDFSTDLNAGLKHAIGGYFCKIFRIEKLSTGCVLKLI